MRITTFLLLVSSCAPALDAVEVTLVPSQPTTLDDLVASVSAPEAEVGLQVSWTWYRDDVEQLGLSGPVLHHARTQKGETWRVEARLVDGRRAGPAGSAEVAIENSPPVVTLRLPGQAHGDQDLMSMPEAWDADGDAVTLAYAWTVDGEPVPELGDTVPQSSTAIHQVWELEVVPSDGEVSGAAARASCTIVNRPPQELDIVLSATEVQEDSPPLIASWTARDPDGHALRGLVRWLVNGVDVGALPDGTIDGSMFRKGDVLRVLVLVTDGEAWVTAESAQEVTVQNTHPEVVEAAIDRDVLFPDSAPSVVMVTDDADDDPLTSSITWFANGVAVGTGTNPPPSSLREGVTLQAEVTLSDGSSTSSAYRTAGVQVLGTTLSFTDTTGDDLASDALVKFFSDRPASEDDFLYLAVGEVPGTPGVAVCAERADWYGDQYLRLYDSSDPGVVGGDWQKWGRASTGKWGSPSTIRYASYFGSRCYGRGSFCPEWDFMVKEGLDGPSIRPYDLVGESSAASFGGTGSTTWKVTLRVASTRFGACGF